MREVAADLDGCAREREPGQGDPDRLGQLQTASQGSEVKRFIATRHVSVVAERVAASARLALPDIDPGSVGRRGHRARRQTQ